MKRVLLIIVLFLIQISIYAQKTVEKIEYWDIWKHKPKTIWHELGDGTKHGIEKVFYENDGTLFSKKTYDYGKLLNYTKYFQDGSINILRNNNKEGKAHGVQQCYEFNEGKRWLKANAKVDNDKLLEYSEYYLPNKSKLLLLNNGVKKEFSRFDEEGNKIAYLNIENGKLSGYTDSHIIFKNNQFESIDIEGLTLQKEGRFYYVKIDEAKEDESPSTGYYVIPDSTSYNFYSEFTYSEYFGIPEFSMNLYLVGLKGEEEQSSLQLQYLEYRPTDVFASTFFRYYLKNHLVRDSLFCEYQKGSNFQNKSMEVLFKKDEKVWEKEYWENGNLKSVKEGKVSKDYNKNGILMTYWDGNELKEFYETGELKNQANAANGTIKRYFKSGSLQEESNDNDFIVYNEQGKILENNKLRETKKKLDDELGSMEKQYVSSNKEIASLLKDKLLFDQTNSNFSSNILTKDNEYVLSAFKLLFNDYDKKSHELIDASNKAIKDLGYSESLSENNAKNDLNEQIKVYEIAINLYEQIIPINENLINTISQFDTFLMSQDLKKINRSLKSVNTSDEVMSVLKL